MIIIMTVLLVAFAAVMFFCRNLRHTVLNRLSIAGYDVATAWNNMDRARARRIIAIALVAIIAPLIIVMSFVSILAVTIVVLGLATGSVYASIPFGLAFVVWFICHIIPRPLDRLPLYGRIFFLSRWSCGIIASVCFVLIAFGVFAPNTKAAMFRSARNAEQTTANKINEHSSHSEPEMGILRKITEDIYAVPEAAGKEPFFVKANTQVMVFNWDESRNANGKREGQRRIMVKNSFGHFDGGDTGWVPIRVIEKGTPAPASTPTPPPAAQKAPEKKEIEKVWTFSFIRGAEKSFPAKEFSMDSNILHAKFKEPSPKEFIFEGTSSDGKLYVGEWFQAGEKRGPFTFDFSNDPQCGKGWTEDEVMKETRLISFLCKK